MDFAASVTKPREYFELMAESPRSLMHTPVVVDGRNVLDLQDGGITVRAAGKR